MIGEGMTDVIGLREVEGHRTAADIQMNLPTAAETEVGHLAEETEAWEETEIDVMTLKVDLIILEGVDALICPEAAILMVEVDDLKAEAGADLRRVKDQIDLVTGQVTGLSLEVSQKVKEEVDTLIDKKERGCLISQVKDLMSVQEEEDLMAGEEEDLMVQEEEDMISEDEEDLKPEEGGLKVGEEEDLIPEGEDLMGWEEEGLMAEEEGLMAEEEEDMILEEEDLMA